MAKLKIIIDINFLMFFISSLSNLGAINAFELKYVF